MSSHREAPEIAKDPVADNTDLYAFVSPDKPDTVTLIANFIPLEAPAGGPNFYEFGEDVLYEIHVDNDGDGDGDVTYQFRFHTEVRNPDTFLYNTGPITSLDSPNWNRRQFYSVTKVVEHGHSAVLGSELACPPCNIGPRSTPDYASLAQAAVHSLPSGETVFAGQRAEGFYVDLGSVFDLGDLRPFQHLHLIPTADALGVNGAASVNVHSIAIQVPKATLSQASSPPTDPKSRHAVIGVWASASRRRTRVFNSKEGDHGRFGAWVQVSRLGNPLFNEVIVPMGDKDRWNRVPPSDDDDFLKYVQHPELAGLLPVLYPTAFPHLAQLNQSGAVRADLVAILLTGIPSGIIPGFQNYTGAAPADLLRLNMAIPPATSPNILGLLGNDLAGFPNGRRVFDDTVTVELRAVAGLTYPLVAPSYVPDDAAKAISDFSSTIGGGAPSSSVDDSGMPTGSGTIPIRPEGFYLSSFPYLGVPYDGFDHPSSPAS